MNRNKKISLIGLAMALMLIFNLLLPPQFSFATDASPSVTLSENSGTTGTGDAGSTTPIGSPSPTTDNAVGDAQTSDNSAPTTNNNAQLNNNDNTDANNFGDAPPIAVNLQNNGTSATEWNYNAIVNNTLKVSTAVPNKKIYAGIATDFNLTFNLKTSSTREESERVKATDTIKLLLSEHFAPSDLKTEQEKDIFIGVNKVGTALFSTEASKLYVTMQFDRSTDFGQSDAGVAITAKLKYRDTSINNQVQAELAKKTFDVYPAPTVTYPMTKSGEILPNGNIEWTIIVNSLENNQTKSLQGTKLVDDLTNVGDYVPNSFKVGGKPTVTGLNVSGRNLEYRFGETTGPQKITFETVIENYFAESDKSDTKINTAKLQKLIGDDLAEASAKVPIPQRKWIKKTGEFITNQKQIEWIIVINEPDAELGDITLKEDLTYGQEFISGYYTIGDSQDQNQIDIPTEKAQKAYLNIRFTNVNKKITVKLISSYEYEGKFTNTASIFNTNSGSGKITTRQSASATVPDKVGGSYAFEKVKMPADLKSKPSNHNNSTIKFDADLREGTLEWKFSLNDITNTPEKYFIYDLLVYQEEGFDKKTLDTNSYSNIIKEIPPSYGMKYHSGLDAQHVIKLTVGGKAVADLIKIPVTAVPLVNNRKKEISFKTKVVDYKAIFNRNNPKQIINSALLFKDQDPVAFSEDSMWFQNSMVYKNAFHPKFSTASNPDHSKSHGYITNFNYNTREVLYRISVNASNADYTKYETVDGPLKPIVVEDDLKPEMEFINFDGEDVPYLIFEGERNVNGIDTLPKANPTALTKDQIKAQGIDIERQQTEPNNIRFIFKQLNKPYYIVLRTKLKDAEYEKLLKNFTPITENNVVKDYAMPSNHAVFYSGNTLPSEYYKRVNVGIGTAIYPAKLEKQYEAVDGMLRWRIEYKPYLLASADSASITDIIPSGVQLPLGADGQPLISTNPKESDKSKIVIRSHSIEADKGTTYSYKEDSVNTPNTLDVKYSVEDGQGKLTFTPQDRSKGYIIEYFTPYSAEAKAGMKITNEAKLWVNHSEHKSASASHTIESGFSISAWLSQIGGVQITKVDADEPSKKLSGAVFVLKDKQNHIVKKGATNEKGELIFAPLGIGEYTLEEETAPNGYTKSADVYRVIVSKNEQGTGKKTVVKKVENNTETALSEPLIEVGNKKIPPSGGGTNQGGGNVPKDPQTPPSTPPSTGGSGGGTPNNQSSVRPDPSTPAKNKDKDPTEPGKKSEDKKTEEKPDPTPEPIPVNTDPNPSNENPPQNPNSNSSIGSPSGSGSGGRRIIGYTPTGEPIYDDATPFGNREKVEQATKSKQGKNDPSRIASAPRTGAGQISLSSMGLAWGSFISLIIALCDRSLSKKRINK